MMVFTPTTSIKCNNFHQEIAPSRILKVAGKSTTAYELYFFTDEAQFHQSNFQHMLLVHIRCGIVGNLLCGMHFIEECLRQLFLMDIFRRMNYRFSYKIFPFKQDESGYMMDCPTFWQRGYKVLECNKKKWTGRRE